MYLVNVHVETGTARARLGLASNATHYSTQVIAIHHTIYSDGDLVDRGVDSGSGSPRSLSTTSGGTCRAGSTDSTTCCAVQPGSCAEPNNSMPYGMEL